MNGRMAKKIRKLTNHNWMESYEARYTIKVGGAGR